MSKLKNITELPIDSAKKIRVVFTDIDDTLSTHGFILAEAYEALWRLHNHGIDVVPITGRCAGWVDHIARMWPVKGVVGENGAFYAYMDRTEQVPRLRKEYIVPPEETKKHYAKFEQIKTEVFARFPTCKVASDQNYREFDLAIDFCEDVPPLSMEDVDEIVTIYEKHGANTKVSSIHVNGWFGDYDKLTMTKQFAADVLHMDSNALKEEALFIGDSPNDQPMFAFFPISVAVKNIEQFLSRLTNTPNYVCDKIGGEGFAQMVDVLLAKKELNS